MNLGAEDGTYTADLTNAALHGDNDAGTGATLNVRAKNITTKSADKFANYKFHLNDDIAQNGGSMLMLTENNGFNGGNPFDWAKLDVDTTGLSGNTVIGNATLLTGTTNGLKFSNYAGRNKTQTVTMRRRSVRIRIRVRHRRSFSTTNASKTIPMRRMTDRPRRQRCRTAQPKSTAVFPMRAIPPRTTI